jgi:hypothetical protein
MLFADSPLPSGPGAEPTLEIRTTCERRAGEARSQLPIIVSDSPPLLPGTQRE